MSRTEIQSDAGSWVEDVKNASGTRWDRPGRVCEGCFMPESEILAHGGQYRTCLAGRRKNSPESGCAVCFFPEGNHPTGRGHGSGCYPRVRAMSARHRSLWRAKPSWRHPHIRMFFSLIVSFVIVSTVFVAVGYKAVGLSAMTKELELQVLLTIVGVFAMRVIWRGPVGSIISHFHRKEK